MATENDPDPILVAKLDRKFLIEIGRRFRVIGNRLDHPAEDATSRIDFVNRQQGREPLGFFDGSGHTRLGEQHTDPPAF